MHQLEKLLNGSSEEIEIQQNGNIHRESILEELNNLISLFFPDSWTTGHFVNEDADYVIYDLELNGSANLKIRILDFGDMFRLVRV